MSMSCGVPSTRLQVWNPKTGITIMCMDSDQLAEKLEFELSSEDIREALGQNHQERTIFPNLSDL